MPNNTPVDQFFLTPANKNHIPIVFRDPSGFVPSVQTPAAILYHVTYNAKVTRILHDRAIVNKFETTYKNIITT